MNDLFIYYDDRKNKKTNQRNIMLVIVSTKKSATNANMKL